MRKPPHVIEIFLGPGECYFGGRDTRIRTLLGSCVSMTFWHPVLLVGGMCHFVLPNSRTRQEATQPDGRYADGALNLLLREIAAVGAPQAEYQVKLFGGGDMFPDARKTPISQVGQRNIEAAQRLVQTHGFRCVAKDLGGIGHRNIIFDIWSGNVWVKHHGMGAYHAGQEGNTYDP